MEDLPDACPIKVPGNWQLAAAYRGRGPSRMCPSTPTSNTPFPATRPGCLPKSHRFATPARFTVAADWLAEGQTRIIFDGVDSAFHLFCSGRWVPVTPQDSRLPAEISI